ncbi:PAS domain S-box protein [Hymenobacter sp. UV11]|uniref:sensor histidine kinase n=1 Tax=Hymenobacter sp. UV11 TaxID=1849735 RepID=UPI00105D4CCF|nr:PAS domain-containing sensor histidine kinase [Hymenobacter sp. UV11]TDN38827.1 PAS domain-containing sensor histidine kinase [Hymenobacter sp. UV11]TFZ63815.1 PAS domain S-box protein [Hymenobacter sp. UV11]
MLSASYTTILSNLLYTHSRDFVGIYDVALGWFTQVNPVAVQLLGYTSEEAFLTDPNHTLREPPWTVAEWHDLCELTQREGHHELETTIRRHRGEPFLAYLRLTYFEAEGRESLLVCLTEQSPLQRAERDLAHSVRRFEAVFTNATIGIVVCDKAGIMVSANELVGHLFGYTQPELLGQRIEVLVPKAAGRHHEQLRESFHQNPQVRSMGAHRALQGQRQNGSVFPVEVSLSYFYLDAELYVVAYILDTSLKQAAEQELIAQHQQVARLNAELEQKVANRTHALLSTLAELEERGQELALALAAERELGELKSRFVSMASHEFRTPLTAVLTSAALIGKYAGGDQQTQRVRHLERIAASVNHLNAILEEFLSVGRIEEGTMEARPTNFDLATLLTETLADVQSLCKPGQTIVRLVECRVVRLDASLLRKILVNLLSNALKYSGDNSTVTVRASCLDNTLLLSVEDQGVGISKEDQAHLFERFFRSRSVSTVPGTGLGLYIIAKYLELLRGTIALSSTLGQGTTVTVTIPYENDSAD